MGRCQRNPSEYVRDNACTRPYIHAQTPISSVMDVLNPLTFDRGLLVTPRIISSLETRVDVERIAAFCKIVALRDTARDQCESVCETSTSFV